VHPGGGGNLRWEGRLARDQHLMHVVEANGSVNISSSEAVDAEEERTRLNWLLRVSQR
jgi:hypothetical protein